MEIPENASSTLCTSFQAKVKSKDAFKTKLRWLLTRFYSLVYLTHHTTHGFWVVLDNLVLLKEKRMTDFNKYLSKLIKAEQRRQFNEYFLSDVGGVNAEVTISSAGFEILWEGIQLHSGMLYGWTVEQVKTKLAKKDFNK